MRRSLVLAGVGTVAFVLLVACGDEKTVQQGGLEILVTSELGVEDVNLVRVEISQESAPGVYDPPLLANAFDLTTGEASLPATVSIAAGKAASQNALVRVVGRKIAAGKDTPVVLREAEVRVPSDRVAALTMLLSAACATRVTYDAVTSTYAATCAPRESCQPATGQCGSSLVDVATLPTYDPSVDAAVPIVKLADASRD